MAPDNRRILCASCGSQIRSVPLLPTEDKTRQARELLERWSKKKWTGDSEDAELGLMPVESQPLPQGGKSAVLRIDEGHPDPSAISTLPKFSREASESKPASARRAAPVPSASQPRHAQASPSFAQRTHEPHGYSAPPPHFPGEPMTIDEPPAQNSSSKLQTFWGQMLAYAGVLALTVGAAFVLMGYFGGPQWQSYTPTGWLITTTGQMLLFLGVVTLVSGGMEQTTEEVARRIEKLGNRLIRIEWASQNHALKGPSLPAEHFQPGGAPQTETHSVAAHSPEG
jgi:hypothetical protein